MKINEMEHRGTEAQRIFEKQYQYLLKVAGQPETKEGMRVRLFSQT